MKNYFIYLIGFVLFMMPSCTTDEDRQLLQTQRMEEQRLLQIMDESSKTLEINGVKSFFYSKKIQDKLYALLSSKVTDGKLSALVKYKPEYFILTHNKDTCIIIYSEDVPFPVNVREIKKPTPAIALKKMTCSYTDGEWNLLKSSHKPDATECLSYDVLQPGYRKAKEKERLLKAKKYIAQNMLSQFSYSDCGFGNIFDMKEIINRKYWFDE